MSFQFKHIDEEGHGVLDAISTAKQFNRWMFESIENHCSGRILEIGSGVGNISTLFVGSDRNIVLSDIRESYRNVLQQRFPGTNVLEIDIARADFDDAYRGIIATFDSIFALNVVEHIRDDAAAIRNMASLIKPGGTMCILVPAFQSLYNGIDLSLEHYKRYRKKELEELMAAHGTIQDSFYFNAVGIAAWWLSGKILRQKTIPEGEMRLFNFFVPVFRVIDKILSRKIGLSAVVIVRKHRS